MWKIHICPVIVKGSFMFSLAIWIEVLFPAYHNSYLFFCYQFQAFYNNKCGSSSPNLLRPSNSLCLSPSRPVTFIGKDGIYSYSWYLDDWFLQSSASSISPQSSQDFWLITCILFLCDSSLALFSIPILLYSKLLFHSVLGTLRLDHPISYLSLKNASNACLTNQANKTILVLFVSNAQRAWDSKDESQLIFQVLFHCNTKHKLMKILYTHTHVHI